MSLVDLLTAGLIAEWISNNYSSSKGTFINIVSILYSGKAHPFFLITLLAYPCLYPYFVVTLILQAKDQRK